MDLTSEFLNFALLGAEWVLWLLVACSVLSIGVIVERAIFLTKRQFDVEKIRAAVTKALADDKPLPALITDSENIAARVATAGIAARADGAEAASEAMNSAKANARTNYERHNLILGTLGNNAPFIGLFGTVLGIMKAFDDLAGNTEGGADVVMSGISEALVATAVGLFVAIPAVIAYNFFNRRIRAAATGADEIAHTILAALHSEGSGAKGKG